MRRDEAIAELATRGVQLVTQTWGAARWVRRSPELAVAESATPVARGAVSHPKWAQVDEMS